MQEHKEKFKVGDLVRLDALFNPERHPPMGTLGVVTDVENWDLGKAYDSNSDTPEQADCEQFVRVYWSIGPNSEEQCYVNSSLAQVTP